MKNIMDEVQASANEESKSSTGDKYETGRAMMHLETEKAATQLADALNMKRALDQIDIDKSSNTAKMGSIVITDNGNFFIAVAIGKIEIRKKDYFVISPLSPLGKELINRKVGDKIVVNARSYSITKVN